MLHSQDTTSGNPLFSSLERRVGRQTFETWFRPLTVTKSAAERVVKIGVPNAVVRDWIVSHYTDALEASLAEQELSHYRIEWLLRGTTESRTRTAAQTASSVDPRLVPAPGLDGLAQDSEPPAFVESTPSLLNDRYTFSSFVVASCNRFAHAAAQAVAEAPGKTYNPLYLYGGVGLGKTHLIQATGHAIKRANPKLQVAYLSLERFMNGRSNVISDGYDKTNVF